MSQEIDPKLLAWCTKARDGELTQVELAALESRLIEDREARAFYREFMKVQSVLERHGASLGLNKEAAGPLAFKRSPRHELLVRTGLKFAALAACIGLLVAVVQNMLQPPQTPIENIVKISDSASLEAVQSSVLVVRGQNQYSILANSQFDLKAGDLIQTNDDSHAIISYQQQQTSLIVWADSRLRLDAAGSGMRHLELDEGSLICTVDHAKAGDQMTLSTPHGNVAGKGSTFVLSSDQKGTEVMVSEGKVAVALRDSKTEGGRKTGKKEFVSRGELLAVMPDQSVKREVVKAQMDQATIKKFTLVDADTKQTIPGYDGLTDGVVFDLGFLPTRRLNIRAYPTAEVSCIFLKVHGWTPDGKKMKFKRRKGLGNLNSNWQSHRPYYVAGDVGFTDQPNPWTPPPGNYLLEAIVYKNAPGKNKSIGVRTELKFKVIDPLSGK